MTGGLLFQRELARRHQREAQQGLGAPIVSETLRDRRFVAVGDRLYHSLRWKTFHDFLWQYPGYVFGDEWIKAETAKPENERHPVFQLRQRVGAFLKSQQKGTGEINSAPMNGDVEAYFRLAYHLYLVNHNCRIPEDVLRRLRDKNLYHGAAHEIYVTATFLKAGFKVTHENERDSTRSHCEFAAEHKASGKRFSVEAKARTVETTRMRDRLTEALLKKADHPLIAWIAINAPAANWQAAMDVLKDAMKELRDREAKAVVEGQALQPAYVIVSNNPYLFAGDSTDYVSSLFADGFKIPDFKLDQPYYSTREMRLTREKHRAMYDLLSSIRTHAQIPTTFDGEDPDLAYRSGPPRMEIGQMYEVPDEGRTVNATLEDATVNVPEKRVYGIYRTVEGRRIIVTNPLTDAEMAAYARHPDTFFRVLKRAGGRKMRDPLDFYDSSRPIYGQTPKEKLLEFMKGASDMEYLKTLSQGELADIFCERLADSIYRKEQVAKEALLSGNPPPS